MIDQQAVRQWHRDRRRPLQILGVLLGVVVLLGCAERLHESIGTWGVFVFWAVAGLNAAAWPLAFLVIEIGRAPRGGRAVLATALGITLSSLGLLLVGWGLVMVLVPEYTVGWYLPARGGNGTEIRDATGARSAGRLMTLVGAVGSLLAVALAVAVGDREPEAHDATTRRQRMRRMRNRETRGEGRLPSLAATLGANAGIAMLACGGLFWLVALGIGLISMIQYRGVRERLAECLPGSRSCSTEIWMANELPWVLALGSVLALLVLGVVLRRTWWSSDRSGNGISSGERTSAAASLWLLVGGAIFSAAAVIAQGSAVLYARWSESTCTGRGSLRSCGARAPEFSFVQEWAPWVILWVLAAYAVIAYLIVFGTLAERYGDEYVELAPRGRKAKARLKREGIDPAPSSARHVTVYLLALTLLCSVGWSAIGAWHLATAPAAASGSWEEYVASATSAAEHPHLEEAAIEVPSGRSPEIPVSVQITMAGEAPEMPAAEALDLLDAACAYVPSPWRSTTAESTWVRVTYSSEGNSSRFVHLDCGAGQRQAVGDLLTWMEQHPAGSAVKDVSLKTRHDGALEAQLYLAGTAAPTARAGLEHLCALPETEGVQRTSTLLDSHASREVRDVDCSDLDAVLETWRRQD